MRFVALLAAGLTAASALAAAPASQAPADVNHSLEMVLGDTATVEGDPSRVGTSLVNLTNDDGVYGCEGTADQQCEVVLVKVENPYEEENARKGRENATLSVALDFGTFGTAGASLTDMAIAVYESDESGTRGELVGTFDDNPPAAPESGSWVVTSTPEESVFLYRVELIYGAHGGGYTADFEFFQ